MNHNMRKMFTEQQIVDLVNKNSNVYLLSGFIVDTDEDSYVIIPQITTKNDDRQYSCYAVKSSGGIYHLSVNFDDSTVIDTDTTIEISMDTADISLSKILTNEIVDRIEV